MDLNGMKNPAKHNPKAMDVPLMGIALAAAFVFTSATGAFAAGLPQLDPTTYSSQLIWLGITFTVLYLLMSVVALPRISKVLEERRHHIDGRLEKAERLKDDAQAAARSYEKALAEARDKSRETIVSAKEAATREANKKQAELATRLGVKIRAAEDAIAKARGAALDSIGTVAAEIAQTAAARLAGLDFGEDEARAAVVKVLSEENKKETKS